MGGASSSLTLWQTWQLRHQELEEDLRATRKERERLELSIEKLRKDLQASESSIAMVTCLCVNVVVWWVEVVIVEGSGDGGGGGEEW